MAQLMLTGKRDEKAASIACSARYDGGNFLCRYLPDEYAIGVADRRQIREGHVPALCSCTLGEAHAGGSVGDFVGLPVGNRPRARNARHRSSDRGQGCFLCGG